MIIPRLDMKKLHAGENGVHSAHSQNSSGGRDGKEVLLSRARGANSSSNNNVSSSNARVSSTSPRSATVAAGGGGVGATAPLPPPAASGPWLSPSEYRATPQVTPRTYLSTGTYTAVAASPPNGAGGGGESIQQRAINVAPLLGFNPLECTDAKVFQRRLIEMTERALSIEKYYKERQQERDEYYTHRLAALTAFVMDESESRVKCHGVTALRSCTLSRSSSAARHDAPDVMFKSCGLTSSPFRAFGASPLRGERCSPIRQHTSATAKASGTDSGETNSTTYRMAANGVRPERRSSSSTRSRHRDPAHTTQSALVAGSSGTMSGSNSVSSEKNTTNAPTRRRTPHSRNPATAAAAYPPTTTYQHHHMYQKSISESNASSGRASMLDQLNRPLAPTYRLRQDDTVRPGRVAPTSPVTSNTGGFGSTLDTASSTWQRIYEDVERRRASRLNPQK